MFTNWALCNSDRTTGSRAKCAAILWKSHRNNSRRSSRTQQAKAKTSFSDSEKNSLLSPIPSASSTFRTKQDQTLKTKTWRDEVKNKETFFFYLLYFLFIAIFSYLLFFYCLYSGYLFFLTVLFFPRTRQLSQVNKIYRKKLFLVTLSVLHNALKLSVLHCTWHSF